MKLDSAKYRVAPDRKLRLSKWPTEIKPLYKSKAQYRKMLDEQIDEMRDLQSLLYAHNSYALLVVFQAMDAAGKDSAIKHVMSGVNPQGCQVYSFQHPSAEELDHDFLWRTTRCLPQRGRIGIFNRSYYEEVLIVRVHPDILRAESLPAEILDEKAIWEGRFRSINDLESHLHRCGTRILKFFLHISKEEQRQRFLARLEEPDKNWKFNIGDLSERGLWDKYMKAYEECLRATSTKEAPWFVVPADDKKNARLLIAETIVAALKKLKMSYPQPSQAHRKELQAIQKMLANEKP
ncbi:MAG TPA: ADP-polyphosphate phosphotransferase [Chthoniobacterales bacterium]|nr:ADP-polyphosphate phosphotransferase [Chthoniobacterales bacterium]